MSEIPEIGAHLGALQPPRQVVTASRFRLLSYFSVVSLIGMVLVVAGIFVLSGESMKSTLLRQESSQGIALGRTMLNALWPNYAPLALRAHTLTPAALADQLENIQLRKQIYELTRTLNIVKIRIYTTDGRVVFSNWDTEIGAIGPDDGALQSALAGTPQSTLSFQPRFEAINGRVRDRSIVKTLLAIDHPVSGARQGVMEIHTDVSNEIIALRDDQLRLGGVLGLGMLGLFVFLMLAVKHAERTMQAQQKALADSESRARMLARVVEQSRDSIVTRDMNGMITTWNHGAETIFGFSKEEVIGRSMRDVLLKDAPEKEWQEWLTRLRTGGTFMIRDWRPTKRGGRVHVVGSSGPLTDDSGKLVGDIAVTHDTTMLEYAQEELRRAKEAAEAAALSKSEFLANMSHEIRTPMNGIIGMTQLALGTALDAEQRDCLGTIKSSSEALLHIINDILDLSKIEAGKLEIESIPFSLRYSLQQTIRVLAVRAHEKRLELIWSVDAAVPDHVIGDPLRIRQIILNLVGNAIKFTTVGEVEIQVRLEDVQERAVRLRFRVRDTGIGIPENKRDAIFEAFEQADTSTTRQFGGTGLGLSICRWLVGIMGGSIGVSSVPGVGSTFEFSLSLGLQNVRLYESAGGASSPAEAFLQQPVLVVDDNRRCRELICAYVQSWGMQATACDSAAAALETITRARADGKPFRLALIDGTLPDGSAFELATEVMAENTSVIVLADTTQGPAIAQARAHGHVRALVKPVSQSTLLDGIAIALDPALLQLEQIPLNPAEPASAMPETSLDILLVEDNAVNRKLAVRLLEKLGHQVSEAHNGADAVAMTRAHRYNVILMDMQMPVMDGLDATRAIRAGETAGTHTPIIAVTANAMSGDRERCIKAGMDDYVSKPIDLNMLVNALERVSLVDAPAGHEAAPRGLAPALIETPSNPATAADHVAHYNRKSALARTADDADLLAQIIDIFIAETPSTLEKITGCLKRGECEGAFRTAHSLKGSCSNLSADTVHAAARALEIYARDGDLAAARAALPKLQESTAALLETLVADRALETAAQTCRVTS